MNIHKASFETNMSRLACRNLNMVKNPPVTLAAGRKLPLVDEDKFEGG